MSEGAYSAIADKQLDELESGADADLYNAVLDTCELIFALPEHAQSRSSAITSAEGIRFRFSVAGFYPYKVNWSSSSDGPRIEAVFGHP